MEKLQLIATAKATPSSKIKWLQYFNSSASTREARRLPPKLINEDKLATFLSKACWWAGVRCSFSIEPLCHLLLYGLSFYAFQYFYQISSVIAHKRLFYLTLQISEQAAISFDEMMRQDRIPIDMNSPLEPLTLSSYIEESRIQLWDHAFTSYFRGHDAFKKSDEFVGFRGADLAVRRVLFRYETLYCLPFHSIVIRRNIPCCVVCTLYTILIVTCLIFSF